jgi:hypothetical protein
LTAVVAVGAAGGDVGVAVGGFGFGVGVGADGTDVAVGGTGVVVGVLVGMGVAVGIGVFVGVGVGGAGGEPIGVGMNVGGAGGVAAAACVCDAGECSAAVNAIMPTMTGKASARVRRLFIQDSLRSLMRSGHMVALKRYDSTSGSIILGQRPSVNRIFTFSSYWVHKFLMLM